MLGEAFVNITYLETEFPLLLDLGNCVTFRQVYFAQIPIPNMIYLLKKEICIFDTIQFKSNNSLHTNPLARNLGQVKLDSDK